MANSTRILERDPGFRDMRLRALQAHFRVNHRRQRIEDYAVALLEEGKTAQAWQVLLTLSNYHVHA